MQKFQNDLIQSEFSISQAYHATLSLFDQNVLKVPSKTFKGCDTVTRRKINIIWEEKARE